MANIRVRSLNVKKGIEYDGLVPNGNAFWLTDKTRISVNRSPFAHDKQYDPIFTKPSYKYSFEADTNIMLLNVSNIGTNPYYSELNKGDVDIVSGTESDPLVTLTAVQAGADCVISARFSYDNIETNSNANVIINLKKDGNQIATYTADVAKKTLEGVGVQLEGVAVTVGDVFTVTCESNKNGEIKGSTLPTIVQYEIRS